MGIDHDHSRSYEISVKQNKKFVFSIVITFIFAIIEAVAGYYSNSLALLSDAGHMITDVAALSLALFASWMAARPASSRHTFGFLRMESIAALLNGLFMLLLVVFIVIEALERLYIPHEVHGLTVFIVATIGLLANLLIIFVLSQGHTDLNTRGAILHVMGDLLGSVAAILAGAMIYFGGWYLADPILSVVISMLILFSNFRLLRDAFLILMESVPRNIDLEEVEAEMKNIVHVVDIHDLHIWNVASSYIALSAHVVLDNFEIWPEVYQNLSNMLKDKFDITHITLQPELRQ